MTRLLAGPDGADSPELPDRGQDPLPLRTWHVWTRIGDDRAADRPSNLHDLAEALQLDAAPRWFLWWDRPHRGGADVTHCASLVGGTVVTGCGYSTPARPELRAWEIVDPTVRDSWRTYCATCEELTPSAAGAP